MDAGNNTIDKLDELIKHSKYFFYDIDFTEGYVELDYVIGFKPKTVYLPFYIDNIYIKL